MDEKGGSTTASVGISISNPFTISASTDKSSGISPLTVQFSASATSQDGSISSYVWDFGDGTPSETQQNPSHTYTCVSSSCTYTVILTVTDEKGSKTNTSVTIKTINIIPSKTVKQVSAGKYHTCALLTDGGVKCWGENYTGKLGDGTTNNSNVPVSVLSITNAISVSAGSNHTCTVISDGTIKCWGSNSYYVLGMNAPSNYSSTPILVSSITNAVSVSAGEDHTCALLSDGTTKCWGFGNKTPPVLASSITNAISISSGNEHACALLSDGTVKCWGNNYYGQLGNGNTTYQTDPVLVNGITNAINVSAGYYSTSALLSNATIKCWGIGGYRVVSSITNATSISAAKCAVLSDGTVKCNFSNPVLVKDITNAVSVSASVNGSHICALLLDGTVRCWGSNYYGQLGDGTNTYSSNPVFVDTTLYALNPLLKNYFLAFLDVSNPANKLWYY